MSDVGKPVTILPPPGGVGGGGWDGVGVAASCLCLIHCLAFPLLIAALPALATVVGKGEAFHFAILGVAIPSSLFALWVGRGRHRSPLPLTIGLIGLTLLSLAVLGQVPEIAGTVAGSILLVTAHIANWCYRRAASA